MRDNGKRVLLGLPVPLVLLILVGVWLSGLGWPGETLVERAHRMCADCGISGEEIDALIDNGRHSRISREESIRLWEGTYEGQEDATELIELCCNCVEVIVDASVSRQQAGRRRRSMAITTFTDLSRHKSNGTARAFSTAPEPADARAGRTPTLYRKQEPASINALPP